MPMMGTAVVVGPSAVRSPTVMACPPTELVANALACIDDVFALVDDHPVSVAGLWREVFSTMFDESGSVALICPSWWSDRRIATVSDAARTVAPTIVLARRSEVLASAVAHRASAVVEISESFIALSRGSGGRPLRTVSRAAEPAVVADEVVREIVSLTGGRGAVVVDSADGVGGAQELGDLTARRLRAHGFAVTVVDDDRLLEAGKAWASWAAAEPTGDDESALVASRPQRRRIWSVAGGVAAAGVLAVAVMAAGEPAPARSPTTLLVEGNVVVQVPAAWTARRVIAGPGSARVQVTSPTDPHVALHVTQSPVPVGETLARTADTLRRAVLAERPGIFVDFNPEDRRGDRLAVTYREIRDGHDIRWTVLLDGALRISIGCQSARGSEAAVRPACEQAIASARNIAELTGTVAPQRQSNNT